MSQLLPFMLMTDVGAAFFRQDTAGDENRLDPVRVRGGTYTGKWALNANLKTNTDFEHLWPVFNQLSVVALDIEVAFPPTPEELAARKAAEEE